MKLDRNTDTKGRGKYALVNMRKLIPILDKPEKERTRLESLLACYFEFLVSEGIVSLGNETPGDQFFVMKYKDMFTAPALQAYANAIKGMLRYSPKDEEQRRIGRKLGEYMRQMEDEADTARELGDRIPD